MGKTYIPQIEQGFLFATPPGQWWAKWICRILKAKTFHWGVFIKRDENGWIIAESIQKGVAVTRFNYPKAYVYHIKGLRVNSDKLLSIVSYYGAYPYDFDVYFHTALWWICKHYFGKIIPVIKDKEFHCQEFICAVAAELGIQLLPEGEPPACINLEYSVHLEYLGVINDIQSRISKTMAGKK